MIDPPDDPEAFAREIADLNGTSLDLAFTHASLIGDMPELDAAGLHVVRDHDRSVIATIRPEAPLAGWTGYGSSAKLGCMFRLLLGVFAPWR